ncbi:MAG: GHMP family kinase ATP-binding protein [Desulfocucumaceae bacterium]
MIISQTPFRISFFGGGTDYPAYYRENGGVVLSTTIDKYCYITCRYLPRFFDHSSRIVYSKTELVNSLDEIKHPSVRECLKFMKIENGVEIHHDADLPARSGLGSSSAFTVGLLHTLHALKGRMPSKLDLALQAICVEQELIGENVGSQDQCSAAFGGLNRISFNGKHEIDCQPVIVTNEKMEMLQDRLVMFYTGIARTASEVAEEQIKKTPALGSQLSEMKEMVDQAIDILGGSGDGIDDFGRLLHESWMLKRSLTSKITNDHIDNIYEAARRAGALGGKLLGAGSGGFMVFFIRPENRPGLLEALKGLLHVPFRFDFLGSRIIYYRQQPEVE